MVKYRDGENGGQGLREHQAESTEAEKPRAARLEPETEGRFVDRDETSRVEGGEEEVVPACQHAFHGRGIIIVAITVLPGTVEVKDGSRQHYRRQPQVVS